MDHTIVSPMGVDSYRAFIALDLPVNICQALRYLQDELQAGGVRARWVRTESAHLTVRFLGDVPATGIAMIADALAEATISLSAPALLLSSLGVFPNLKRARVVWAGLGGGIESLRKIKQGVDVCLEAADRRLFPSEHRAFKAHLTLGRFKGCVDGKRLMAALKKSAAYKPVSFTADSLVLYRSDLKPQGPVYTALGRWTLPKEVQRGRGTRTQSFEQTEYK